MSNRCWLAICVRNLVVVLSVYFAATLSAAEVEAIWPQFRGPGGQGHAPTTEAPTEWSETKGVRWKIAVPGRGWSSPVVWGDQIWMTTAIEQAATEEEVEASAKGLVPVEALNLASKLSLRAICIDRTTGKLLHNVALVEVDDPKAIHSLNSYASPTPVIDHGQLYCHFGRYGTVCVEVSDLSVVWERKFEIEHYVGPGSSPCLCGDLLVLTCDGADQQYIAAVDKDSGEDRWKVDRPPIRSENPDFRKSYCTPLVVEYDAREEIVVTGAQWIVAYSPLDGREIWRVDHGSGFSVVPRPVADDGHVYCCTGFSGAGVLAVRLGGSGDVSETHVTWSHLKQAPTQSSPLLHQGKMYLVSDSGIGQCLDATNGDVLWKKRLPGDYSASPLRVGERIYFFSRDGDTTVLSTADKGSRIATNQLDSGIMATPAAVDGALLIRTETHLYAIGQ